MTAHNLAALRVQDPVLTKLAQGYHNLELIGEVLMPTVEIDKEAGKIRNSVALHSAYLARCVTYAARQTV